MYVYMRLFVCCLSRASFYKLCDVSGSASVGLFDLLSEVWVSPVSHV